MINLKNVLKGSLFAALVMGALFATPVSADNSSNNKAFLNAKAALKAEVIAKWDSAVGVMLGANNTVRIVGAKVTSVNDEVINANVPFGNSSLSFALKLDNDTKLNGRVWSNDIAENIKVGDKISFGGTMLSSTSSVITVDASHILSQGLYKNPQVEDKSFWRGEIKSINESDNSLTVKLPSDRTVKVAVSSSTAISLDGAVKTLADLDEGDKVEISGKLNSDGTVITATKLSVTSDNDNDGDEDQNDDRPNNKDNRGENKGWFGKFRNWFWK